MGYKVKQYRLAKGWTQEQLAKASGVSRQTISNLESGKMSRVNVRTLEKLAMAFCVTVGELFFTQDV